MIIHKIISIKKLKIETIIKATTINIKSDGLEEPFGSPQSENF